MSLIENPSALPEVLTLLSLLLQLLGGDLQIQKVAQFAQYYILASLPPLFAAQPPQVNQIYHTFTRTSIAKGQFACLRGCEKYCTDWSLSWKVSS